MELISIFHNISILHYIFLSFVLFLIGICGFLMHRQNLIGILISIEIILLGINISFVASSIHWENIIGQIFAIFILSVAAAEIAIGLAIIVVFYKQNSDINIDDLNKMQG